MAAKKYKNMNVEDQIKYLKSKELSPKKVLYILKISLPKNKLPSLKVKSLESYEILHIQDFTLKEFAL
jgi:hypothetical protein